MNKQQPMPPFPWQDSVWTTFVSKVNSGRLAHAMLLSGDHGGESLAYAMSHFLFCSSPIETVVCGKCKDCELYLAGSHPDFYQATLLESSKQIKVDQIRAVNEFVGKTAQRNSRKVVLISPAGAMNTNAANALLKCLEEPAGDTVFILVQETQKVLLPTIRSRCSVVELPSPSRRESVEWLQSKGVENPEQLLSYSSNAPLTAWAWQQDGSFALRQKVFDVLNNHLQKPIPPLQLVAGWKGLEPLDIATTILLWLESVIRSTQNFKDGKATVLFRVRDSVMEKRNGLILGANLNQALLLEEIAIDLRSLSK